MLFRRREDREISDITKRIQAVVSRQSGQDICSAANALKVPALDLARLLDAPVVAEHALMIDVVTALAYEAGIDPQWLLTGEYDGAVHRHVLTLGEERSAQGKAAVRHYVQQQYGRLRRDSMFAWWPKRRSGRQRRARSTDAAKSA